MSLEGTNEATRKLKDTRARHAAWVTRAIKQYESSGNSPSVLTLLRDRISSQLTKLQNAHDEYCLTLPDDATLDGEEEWMDGYFQRASSTLAEIDSKLQRNPTENMSHLKSTSETDQKSPKEEGKVQRESLQSDTSNDVAENSSSLEASMDDTANTTSVRTQIDSWIDDLEIGQETELLDTVSADGDIKHVLTQLTLDRDLPKIELPVFDGSPLAWPRFVEQFFVQVHSKPGLNDARRMDLLQSHVKGEAKHLIQGLGYSGKNYAQSLKELKFAFGHRVIVARAYIDAITLGNVLPSADSVSLRNFYVSVRDCITTLHQMNYVGELASSDVLQKTAKRIPSDKRSKWNDYVKKICRSREPTLKDLETWLKDCIESDFNPYAISPRQQKPHQANVRHTNAPGMKTSAEPSCPLCFSNHHISKCTQYLQKSQEGRYELVKASRLCFNCLNGNHRIADCKSTVHCKTQGCTSKHHTTLHRSKQSSTAKAPATGQVNSIYQRSLPVYFQVLPIIAQGKNGRTISTFALLDSASDITMINAELAEDLGLRGQKETLVVNTVNSTKSISSKRVSLSVRAPMETDSICIKEAWTNPGVFKCPSMQHEDLENLSCRFGIKLVDVPFGEVKLLIGANVPRAHIQIDRREGHSEEPVAIRTILGWCIMGTYSSQRNEHVEANVNLISQEDSLSQQIENFWKTESFGVSVNLKKPTSAEDLRAMKILERDTKSIDGHYEVPMLWKNETNQLPDNRLMAGRRFDLLTRRLSRDTELRRNYQEVMNGYISNGYAKKLSSDENIPQRTWYLPHHCVLNPNKPGKVRVVFDAAAEHCGVSLNSQLMSGPDLANNLFDVIQLFRMKPIAMVADIKEMFHQVKVPDDQNDALRFLWKEDLEAPGPPDIYKMSVHIFGAKDSPCCVNYALRKIAAETDNLTSHAILNNFYVDDLLISLDDAVTAASFAHRISMALSQHGFQLTKWMSNSREALSNIPQTTRATPKLQLDLDQLPVQRALGLVWNVENDNFTFNPVIKPMHFTKRALVSAMSTIFDPCGFLTPFTFRAKCIIQEVWRAQIDWDDIIPEELQESWKKWYNEITHLSDLQIPRFHGCYACMSLELHLFCDASEFGFAAVAYLRMKSSEVIKCSLLASKSHVAPIKKRLTIPKLELQGAVMAVRLSNTLMDILQVERVVYWTDAMTVLKYINNEHRRWKTFVANRITEIRESSVPSQWNYVPSQMNPADDATRGLPSQILTAPNRWIMGPAFLWQMEAEWPMQPDIPIPKDEDCELKHSSASILTMTRDCAARFNVNDVVDIKRFSSWYKLLRHTAWILRAARMFTDLISKKSKLSTKGPNLSVNEIQDAENCLVRLAQQEGFSTEYKALLLNKGIDGKSSICSLQPFIDHESYVMRVGGRLKNAPDSVRAKHQVILPYDHYLSILIAKDYHDRFAHAGPEQMISMIRQLFWPVKCRQLVKKVIHSCMDCRKRSTQPVAPLMSDLPRQRISGFTKPFQYTGVDYFGPMLAKRARSRIKKWGCIFTCLVTRAVHLELVDSLLTDDFIMALRCFISRRGSPSEIFSDNGTNFKGADRELQEQLDQLNQDKIRNYLLQSYIEWHFIPPHAPHFGGVWESLVKSVKRALKSILKDQVIPEAVLRTTLTEVEAVVNSRPLTYNSSDPTDFTALTPNHFLHGGASHIAPISVSVPQDICSRKRWRQSQLLADHIWKRWLREYLPGLTSRRQWQHDVRNLQENDLVLLKEDNLPRGQWKLGRVMMVYPSADGRVRTVRVKTATGEYCRPAVKICLLEEGHGDG